MRMEMNEKLNKGEAMEANMEWAGDGLQWMKRRNEADAQGISGQLAAIAGALSPLTAIHLKASWCKQSAKTQSSRLKEREKRSRNS